MYGALLAAPSDGKARALPDKKGAASSAPTADAFDPKCWHTIDPEVAPAGVREMKTEFSALSALIEVFF